MAKSKKQSAKNIRTKIVDSGASFASLEDEEQANAQLASTVNSLALTLELFSSDEQDLFKKLLQELRHIPESQRELVMQQQKVFDQLVEATALLGVQAEKEQDPEKKQQLQHVTESMRARATQLHEAQDMKPHTLKEMIGLRYMGLHPQEVRKKGIGLTLVAANARIIRDAFHKPPSADDRISRRIKELRETPQQVSPSEPVHEADDLEPQAPPSKTARDSSRQDAWVPKSRSLKLEPSIRPTTKLRKKTVANIKANEPLQSILSRILSEIAGFRKYVEGHLNIISHGPTPPNKNVPKLTGRDSKGRFAPLPSAAATLTPKPFENPNEVLQHEDQEKPQANTPDSDKPISGGGGGGLLGISTGIGIGAFFKKAFNKIKNLGKKVPGPGEAAEGTDAAEGAEGATSIAEGLGTAAVAGSLAVGVTATGALVGGNMWVNKFFGNRFTKKLLDLGIPADQAKILGEKHEAIARAQSTQLSLGGELPFTKAELDADRNVNLLLGDPKGKVGHEALANLSGQAHPAASPKVVTMPSQSSNAVERATEQHQQSVVPMPPPPVIVTPTPVTVNVPKPSSGLESFMPGVRPAENSFITFQQKRAARVL